MCQQEHEGPRWHEQLCVTCTGDTGGLVTTEEYQWVQDPNAQTVGFHPVLPRDPEGGIPWLTVRPAPVETFMLQPGMR